MKYLTAILICVPLLSQAQYSETIASGRPGQAISPNTVGRYVFQMQAGVDRSGFQAALDFGGIQSRTAVSGCNVFRLGLTERFEVGGDIGYRSESGILPTVQMSGVHTMSLRMRHNVLNGSGAVPSIGVQYQLNLPFLDPDYNPDHIAPKITVMSGQSFGKLGFTVNAGAAWNGVDANPEAFYILNFAYPLSNKLGAFVEHYGFYQSNNWTPKVDGGFAFLATNNLQLDVLGGYGFLSSSANDWFMSVGVSWRTKFREAAITVE